MGEVYRARDSRLNRDVAIKVLSELLSSEPENLRRFEREARAAAALNHRNILAVYQLGTYEGAPYLVSELLEGMTMQEILRSGPLPLRKAIDYGIQIANGLTEAHEKGVIHRDLKPGNLFVTKDGQLKILDFGLAKLRHPEEDTAADTAPTLTIPGEVWGTASYMSPEQVRGKATDRRSDIFAFGAILYEMVMGRRAFHKETSADTMSAVLNEEPSHISGLSPNTPLGLQKIVYRCLQKKPEQRFQSASDLAFALEALSDSTLSSPVAGYEKKQPRTGLQLLAAAAGLVIVLGAVGLAYFWGRTQPQPRVSNYVQLTHDGQQKSLIGTDGSRLYLGLGVGSSASLTARGLAEMSMAGGVPRRIPILPSPDMIPVDLSPDGSELLIVDGRGAPPKGPIWSLPLLGGSPRRLGDIVGETAAWSRDGKALAYTNLGDLFLANADGTGSHKLVSVEGDINNLVWSPNGDELRFDGTESAGGLGQQLFWEASVHGTGLHRLLEGWRNPADECCGKWTADGNYFVFQSDHQIWALPRKSSLLGSDPKPIPLTSSPLSLSSPLPSKDGKKLFVVGETYRGELTRYDTKSGQFLPFLGGISAEYADFSRNGEWVAYVSYREGTLWRCKTDGSDRVQLTYPPLYAMLPRWSPDGKNIVFFEFWSSSDKPARMYEVSVDGGSPRELIPEDRGQQLDPNWSPDGSKIVYGGQSNDAASVIRIFDLTTRQVSEVPGSQGLYSPRWAPTGKYISAFSSDSTKLLLFDFQTQKWTDLAEGSFSWQNLSKDGQYVYVLDSRGGSTVVRISIRDHKTERVADLKNFLIAGRYGGSLALAPDDSPLLLRDAGTQDVFALDWESP